MGIIVLVLAYLLYRVSRRWGPEDEPRIGGIHLALIFTDVRLFLGFVSKILFVPMMASGAVLAIVGIVLAFF